ncbi:MAG: penicillin-binding protein 1B [Salinisphaeraceae bacterium]|nr:penicillin-binding protein 1B [Salinisphaeraceae bacterium]
MAKKKTPRKKSPPRRSLLGMLWAPLVVLGCILALLAAMYTVYLDLRVRSQFEGARWSLPAKVYARPLEVYPGLKLNSSTLQEELQRLGYRASEELSGPGAYRAQGDRISVISRSFRFWDGLQAARQVRIDLDGNRIERLSDILSGEEIAIHRFDPLLIGSIYPVQGEDRILVKLSEVPNELINGLQVVEDRNFPAHFGVDPKAIMRAMFANMQAGQVVQGGSTLTQQLVKNFFLTSQRSLVRKAKEAVMAMLLEMHYSKDEILEAYLNEVYLGQDGARAVHGFGLGSHFFFRKPLSELEIQEIALLVGMVKGPSYYDPRRHPERATQRRNLALDMFAEAGMLDAEGLEAAKNKPLGVTEKAVSGTTRYPAFVDLVRRQLNGQYREADLTSEGLRVFTTLDPRTQEAAEANIRSKLKELDASRGFSQGTLQAAVVVTSVENGEVLAVVGDRDTDFSGFNRALDAKRPIGSLIKPVVYLTALARPRRYNLVTLLNDEELAMTQPNGKLWRPQNYDKRYHGDEVPLWQSLVKSYNVATVRLAMDVGIPAVVETLKQLGYKRNPLAVPSLALGTVEMAPLEVAQVYNTLASGGYYTPLLSINSVLSKEGDPLTRYQLRLRQAFDEGAVYQLNWAMQRVVREGTARSAYNVFPKSLNLAGKTGTTDDLRDSWFAGYSGNRLTVAWVGRDNNKPSRLTGASGALQLWKAVMKDLPLESLEPVKPESVIMIPLDITEVEHDDEDCDISVPVPFIRGTVPGGDFEPCEEGGGRRDKSSNWFLDLFR